MQLQFSFFIFLIVQLQFRFFRIIYLCSYIFLPELILHKYSVEGYLLPVLSAWTLLWFEESLADAPLLAGEPQYLLPVLSTWTLFRFEESLADAPLLDGESRYLLPYSPLDSFQV